MSPRVRRRGGFGFGELWELYSFRFLRLIEPCGSAPPPCRCPSLVVHPGTSLIPAHSGSCVPFLLLRVANVLAAPVPVTRFCTSLRTLARPGLRPASHRSPLLFPPSRPPPYPVCPFAAPLLTHPVAGVAPISCGRGFGLCSTSYSSICAPTAWDCLESGQGEIHASFAGGGDTSGCRPLLGGAATAVICVLLRASGETLCPVLRIWTATASRPRSPL